MSEILYSLLVNIQQNILFSFGVLIVAAVVAFIGWTMMRGRPVAERQRALFLLLAVCGVIIILAGFFGSLLLISLY